MLSERKRDVHAVERRDQGRRRQQHGRRRQILHHVVQVVVDERGERVERAVQDVRVNGRRLERLLVLDHRVLELVAVVLRKRQLAGGVRAGERDRVGLQRRREINERLLDRQQFQEDFVRNGLVERLLQRDRALMDVVQVAKEQDAAVPQQTEREAILVARRAHAADLVEKRRRHGRVRAADGDDGPAEQNDAERDGAVRNHLVVLHLARHMDDEHRRIVVVVETRTFVGVEGVCQKVARDLRMGEDVLKLGRCRLDEIDPARRRELLRLLEPPVFPFVDRHHDAFPPDDARVTPTDSKSGRRSRRANGCPGFRI